jgi:hypothetical protein
LIQGSKIAKGYMASANILCQLPQVNVILRRKIMRTPSMVNYEYCHEPLGLAIISDPASPRRPSGSHMTQMKVKANVTGHYYII